MPDLRLISKRLVLRTPGSAKSPAPSSTPSSPAPSEAKRTAASCFFFSSPSSGSVMIGFAFASRAASRSGTGSASAFAGVEPKKEERKLFFLGSMVWGITPAVRIGPPFSSTCPSVGSDCADAFLAAASGFASGTAAAASATAAGCSSVFFASAAAEFFSPGLAAGAAATSSGSAASPSPVTAWPAASVTVTFGDPASVKAGLVSSSEGSLVEEQDARRIEKSAAKTALRFPLAKRDPGFKPFPLLSARACTCFVRQSTFWRRTGHGLRTRKRDLTNL